MSVTVVRMSAMPVPHRGPAASRSFAFGHYVLSPERQLLLSRGIPVRIGGRALDLLTALVERPGELLDKDVLVSYAWPTTFVDAANLKVNMASLRRALGESHAAPKYIATVVGRGYRFIAPVRALRRDAIQSNDDPAMAARVAGLIDAVEAIRLELQQIRGGSHRASPEEREGMVNCTEM
jgi:DNA-binding winged helix-turn-helix (wHTH) protein